MGTSDSGGPDDKVLSRKPKKPPLPRQQHIMVTLLNYDVTRMFWIPGFHLDYGRFLHWAGQRAMWR